jgi:hypothetical protein
MKTLILLLIAGAVWAQPSITPTNLPSATVGIPYSQTFTAHGFSGTITWSVPAGSGGMPPGVTGCTGTGTTCQISGTPTGTCGGNCAFWLQATDGTNTAQVSLAIAMLFYMTPTSLPSGTIGSAYLQALTAYNNAGTVTWSLISGSLPPGLSGCTSGNANPCTISGIPTTSSGSPFWFTIQATDGVSDAITGFSIPIGAAGTGTATLAPGVVIH